MKIKRIICLLVSALVVFGLASCGGETSVAMDNSGSVKSNGGFVVETGEYVYFINGIESYSTEYKTGEVVKGALMRVKKSDFADFGTEKWSDDKSETVVSKIIVSGDYTAGFYIYGDYVYYAVPSAEKDTTGKVKSDKLNFFRTKLDGTSTSSKITSEDFANSASFRYVSKGDKVYLAVYDTAFYVYDAAAGKKVYTYDSEKEPIDELVFDDDNGASVYFTKKPINENLYDKESDAAKQASYQDLYRYAFGDEAEALVLSGKGKYTVGPGHKLEEDNDAVSFTGMTIDLLKQKGGYLYFSYTNLDSTVGGTVYARVADGKTSWKDDVEVLNEGDKNASAIFASGSYYYVGGNGKLHILYVSSTNGLMDYDYTANSLLDAEEPKGDFGVSNIYYSEKIATCTIVGVYGDYLYAYDSANAYYRVNLSEILKGNISGAGESRINKLNLNTSWYQPEVLTVNGKEYLFGVYSDSVYGSYCYAIDIAAAEKDYKDYKDKLGDDEEDDYYEKGVKKAELKVLVEQTRLGKITDADKTTYTNYYDTLTDSND